MRESEEGVWRRVSEHVRALSVAGRSGTEGELVTGAVK